VTFKFSRGAKAGSEHQAHPSRPGHGLLEQFWIFLGLVALIGFVLNEVWEMAQMRAYVETNDAPWLDTLALCTRAALGDVAIVLGLYAGGALAAADFAWGLRGRWNTYLVTGLLGLGVAILIEHAALVDGRWTYGTHMPMIPLVNAGLWPLLQMTLLPPATFWIARRLAGHSLIET
jgi:hypothetical protein